MEADHLHRFAVDEKLAVKPQMVESWTTSPDGELWTFKLRDGLKFSDGQPVTSADVIASLSRWSKVDAMGQMLNARGAAWAEVDDRTFTLALAEPWGFVLDTLGKPGAPVPFILPAKVIAATQAGQPVADLALLHPRRVPFRSRTALRLARGLGAAHGRSVTDL
jgi:peptide/nickel transport system substrate-binding protein